MMRSGKGTGKTGNRRWKWLLAAILALSVGIALTGCGAAGGNSGNAGNSGSSAGSEAGSSAQEEEVKTDENGSVSESEENREPEGEAPAPDTLTVSVTVSDRGEIATADDGTLMAAVPVEVTPAEGTATVHDVMTALHEQYKPDGYAIADGFTNKLWGVETTNNLFFLNHRSLMEAVDTTPVADGDQITATLLTDDRYYSDIHAYFTEEAVSAKAGEEVTLILKGIGRDAEAEEFAVEGAQIGIATADGFEALEGAVTDAGGSVTLTLDADHFEAGQSYIITAQGTVATTATDWSAEGTPTVDVDAPLMASYCVLSVE